MLKTLSVKTRRPDLSAAEFRRHYEGRHVPLGLAYQDRFGWRKYARNHVAVVRSGEVAFDCLTEFWVASAEDQERTRAFARSPEFRVLDEDDRRFLDVARRLAFEVEEDLLAGPPRGVAAAGTRRVAIVLDRPARAAAAAFGEGVARFGSRLAAEHAWERVTLDRRRSDEPGALALAAILSLWPRAGDVSPPVPAWSDAPGPCAVVDLEVVETPPEWLPDRSGTRGCPAAPIAERRRRRP
jgi:EthD domain